MKKIKKCSLEDLLDLVHIDEQYIDAMIYNVCDNTNQLCPLNQLPCNRQCSINFESYEKDNLL